MGAVRVLTVAHVSAGGVRLAYDLTGDGETVVLLHEIGGTLASWSAVAPALAASFRVLAYDQRGCGGSDRIAGEFSLDTQVSDLRALLAALGIGGPVHLAGVAIGTALAVRFARMFPQAVRSLVLACPALSVSEDRKDYLATRAAAVVEKGMAVVVDNTLGNSYPPEVLHDRDVYDAYRARFLANDPASYAAINLAFSRFDAAPDLAALACPALVLAGRHDRLRPPDQVRAVADRIAGARYAEIGTSGHLMPVQAPAEMSAAMLAFYRGLG